MKRLVSWLDTEWILSSAGQTKKKAIEGFEVFVSQGVKQRSPWDALKNQIFLGDESFVERMLEKVDQEKILSEIPGSQRRGNPMSLDDYSHKADSRNQAIVDAYSSGGYTLAQIGEYFDLHYSTVGGIVRKYTTKK